MGVLSFKGIPVVTIEADVSFRSKKPLVRARMGVMAARAQTSRNRRMHAVPVRKGVRVVAIETDNGGEQELVLFAGVGAVARGTHPRHDRDMDDRVREHFRSVAHKAKLGRTLHQDLVIAA
jgi:hypothetical protein